MGKGVIKDTTRDIHGAILAHFSVGKRYNRLIQACGKEFSEVLDIAKLNLQNQITFVKWMQSINYKYGTSALKLETFWVFGKPEQFREIERYSSEMLKANETRLAWFDNFSALPEVVLKILRLESDKITLVFNSRIVRLDPLTFSRYDLQLLLDWESRYHTNFVRHYMANNARKRSLGSSKPIRDLSDAILYMSIVTGSAAHQGSPRIGVPRKHFKVRGINVFKSLKVTPSIEIYLLSSPLTVQFQRIASILSILREFSFGLLLTEGKPELFDSFYSMTNDGFDFQYLNTSTKYSLIPDVPFSWKVIRSKSSLDLDSFSVDNLAPGSYFVELVLDSLVVEGAVSSADSSRLSELEMYLLPQKSRSSLARENNYFQLTARPGVHYLATNFGTENKIRIDVASFSPPFHFIWENGDGPLNFPAEDDRVHIFAIASGRLYERLQRIMILSATRNTKSKLKFWLFEGFVSPQHRSDLSILAQKYNFEYELVWYKVPRFIPKEEAQQRVIWSYKILFLDVLFPVSVKKVIYIDSDDVVRADLLDLWNIDMGGAPYGFTPFCSDRSDMEKYRFWNDGYWRDTLMGFKYHISALFLVDLKEFRQQSIGPVLRKTYSDLFGDRKSLANLDQDLPNLLQAHGIRIYSLPQEWLWCQSWCSASTMGSAKVIDLCNDPKYGVSKLGFAEKNISEWKGLEAEAESVLSNWRNSEL
jgi:hypothetical protein